jgi:putative LysE/RhtB family amino acid efflux pump
MFVTGLGIGVVVAAQVGPVTLLILRTVLRGGRALAVGLAMAVAVAVIDLLYAVCGLAGIGQVMNGSAVKLTFGVVSGSILIVIGARTTWTGLRARIGLEDAADVVDPGRAFVTAVAATALNPLTIALWTISFPAAAPHAATSSVAEAALLLAGVGLGSLSWYAALTTAVALARRRVGDRLIRAVDVLSGCALVGFGCVIGYRALRQD